MDYLEKYENVFEWLQFCEDMSDKLTWHMTIRESDGKIRGKGYAKEQLRMGLQKAKALGLDKVQIVCRDINIGIYKEIKYGK